MHFILSGSIALGALKVPSEWYLPVAAAIFIVVLIVELIRLKTSAKKMVNGTFDAVLKKSEKATFTGIFWASFAGLLVSPFATQATLSYAFAITAVADPAAALIGKYTSSKKIYRRKSVNGAIAFFVGAFLVSCFYYYLFSMDPSFLLFALFLSLFLTAVEVFSHPIDDNFSLIVFATILMKGVL